MTEEPNPPELPPVFWDAKMVLVLLALVVVVLGLACGPPVVRGWHLGYNSLTDNRCETRVGLQWCGRAARGESGE